MNSAGAAAARRRRAGVAAVELAVLAPFLGIIIMGMFELSRAVMVVDMLDNAARKACNNGIKPGKTFDDINQDVCDILNDNGITTSTSSISINNLSTTVPSLFVQVARYTQPATNPPTWGGSSPNWSNVSDNASYTPKQFDLVKVQVAVPANMVLWFSPKYFSPVSHAIYSSQVVMMRAG
jgi:Flp pilus assembly protein TadG